MSECESEKPSIDVRLRRVESSDLPILFEHQREQCAIDMAVVYARDAQAFESHWARSLSNKSVVALAIIVDELVVGHVSCFEMDGAQSVGYWIAQSHWGKGIATRALELMLQEVTIRPLHARVARSNAASVRVLERCGFVITGYQISPDDGCFPVCEEALLLLD